MIEYTIISDKSRIMFDLQHSRDTSFTSPALPGTRLPLLETVTYFHRFQLMRGIPGPTLTIFPSSEAEAKDCRDSTAAVVLPQWCCCSGAAEVMLPR